MKPVITELFQRVYQLTKDNEAPEFLKHAHECDVRTVLIDMETENSTEILARERTLTDRVLLLRDTYESVVSTVERFPEVLQPAVLHTLSGRFTETLEALAVSEEVQEKLTKELHGVLQRYPEPTDEQMQIVAAQLNEATEE